MVLGLTTAEIIKGLFFIIIAFSGYAVGHVLTNFTSEEMKGGKPYFYALKDVIALASIFFLLLWGNFLVVLAPAFLIFIVLLVSFRRTNKNKEVTMAFALLLALIATIYLKEQNLIFLMTAFTFIYLLASVAILRGMKKSLIRARVKGH